MYKRVYRARGEDVERQVVQKFGNEDRLVGKEGVRDESHLRAGARSVDDRDVRHLAAGAAGRRHDDEAAPAPYFGRGGVEFVGLFAAGGRDDLRDVYDRAAAHGDEAFKAERRHGLDYLVRHHVGGLARAEILHEEALERQPQRSEVFLVYGADGEDKIPASKGKIFRELLTGLESVQFRL
ncbi:hypothetical protein SDC9_173427 [bioreactor metagenome]|uniref:Uncharacterized protein n=1 Tax=bioreactor metagenome TaxID=1076179 RepID=A0A645GH38_9ZZZZ